MVIIHFCFQYAQMMMNNISTGSGPNRDCEMFFMLILPWTQIHSHQFNATELFLKNL